MLHRDPKLKADSEVTESGGGTRSAASAPAAHAPPAHLLSAPAETRDAEPPTPQPGQGRRAPTRGSARTAHSLQSPSAAGPARGALAPGGPEGCGRAARGPEVRGGGGRGRGRPKGGVRGGRSRAGRGARGRGHLLPSPAGGASPRGLRARKRTRLSPPCREERPRVLRKTPGKRPIRSCFRSSRWVGGRRGMGARLPWRRAAAAGSRVSGRRGPRRVGVRPLGAPVAGDPRCRFSESFHLGYSSYSFT